MKLKVYQKHAGFKSFRNRIVSMVFYVFFMLVCRLLLGSGFQEKWDKIMRYKRYIKAKCFTS